MEPSIELLNSLLPEWMLMENNRLNHACILVRHVDKAFAILLWKHDMLRMSLLGRECHDVAIFPWSRD